MVGNIILINYFFRGRFFTYVMNFLKFFLFKENAEEPMHTLLPRLTKHDFLCESPINIFNEKIYLLLWLWLLFLATISLVSLVFYLLCLSPLFRRLILRRRFKFNSFTPVSAFFNKIQVNFILFYFYYV